MNKNSKSVKIAKKAISILFLMCLVIFCMDTLWFNVLEWIDDPVLSSIILWSVVGSFFFFERPTNGGISKEQRILCFVLVGVPMLVCYTFFQDEFNVWPKHVLTGLIISLALVDSYFWRAQATINS